MLSTSAFSFDGAYVDPFIHGCSLDFIGIDPMLNIVFADEVEKEQKRRRHSVDMVAFRRNRKQKQSGLRSEYRRLEGQVKRISAKVRVAAACSRSGSTKPKFMVDTLRELMVEIEGLRHQNIALRNHIGLHSEFLQLLHEANQPQDEQNESILPCIEEQSGRRVHFPGGEPSFYYHPFTRGMFDNTMDSCASQLSPTALPGSGVGEFLGWNVRQATLASGLGCQYLVAKARFSKRVQCSLREAFETMKRERIDSWPVIVTPMNWSSSSSDVSTIVLQRFDDNTSVLVRSVQGEVNLRYVCLVQRSCWTERDGKRVITYGMVIADSEANKRNRSVETDTGEVEWIPEGGAHLTLTEVDDKTIDVVYDHWGGCQGTLHAQYLFVQWAHYAFRWEQMVVPSRLLHSEA
ncbi:hypothetical protein PRNP1_004716 [Phytophthora ramorum]